MTSAFTPAWIAAQRWFRAKQRPVSEVSAVDSAAIGPAELHVLEVAYRDGGDADRYVVVSVDGREPRDGDGAWASIAALIAEEGEIRGAIGRFVANRTDALDDLLPNARERAAKLDERQLRVEQTNTSVVLGDRLILKLVRLLEPGESPDLEIGAFLTDVGFADTPALGGAVRYRSGDGAPAAVVILQELVPARGDAWRVMLETLAENASAAIEQAERIGRVTAEMHAALASRPEDSAFPARAATAQETAAWRASAEAQLSQAVTAVSGEPHQRLVALAPAVTARFADTFGSASGEAAVSRVHGDYHLGQLLARPDDGYSVIDFEGEPARPLEERRRPTSPLRDVAGMLRSLDYAARTARAGSRLDVEAWTEEARAAFVAGYGGIGPDQQALLDAFELEKACYEVRYEASNRPEWLWLPLEAVERLVA